MNIKRNDKFIIVMTSVAYFGVILINALANILPINGMNTGEVSDKYANLFAPAGFTFSIWSVIYLLLLCYIVFNALTLKDVNSEKKKMYHKVSIVFIINCIINMTWIITWHYEMILITLFLMIMLLATLYIINKLISDEELSSGEKKFMQLPFSVYFGWITVATIANVTTYLVSINWSGFGISESIWTVIVIIVGAIIGILNVIKFKSIPYGLVIIWAYFGIISKHTSKIGFDNAYMEVVYAAVISIVLVGISQVMVLRNTARVK